MSDQTVFVHLTDVHIAPKGQLTLTTDTARNLQSVFRRVREMSLRPVCFVLGGDLTNHGEPESYLHLKELLAEAADFGVPMLLALGNHDSRLAFRHVMLDENDASDESERFYYSRSFDSLRIIVLDSMIPGSVYGELGDEQLQWLDNTLADPAPGGDVVVVHHPSIPRGVPRTDDYLLQDRGAFEEVISRHHPMAVLCGHSHVPTVAAFGGTVHFAGPATAFLLDPSIRKGGRGFEGAGFTICTVRDRRLVLNPVILEGMQREIYRTSGE